MADGAPSLPQIKRIVEPQMRSFKRPEARGFLRATLEATEPITVRLPSGLYRFGLGYKVDRERVLRIIRKTVKGLFYHEFGFRFPNNCGIAIVILNIKKSITPANEFETQLAGVNSLLTSPTRDIGDGAFLYRFGRAPESRYQTVWFLAYGGFLAAHAFTDRKGALPGAE
jgi:hypothetical protein